MNAQPLLLSVPKAPRKPHSLNFNPKEWKIVALRECIFDAKACDTPDLAAQYWRDNIPAHPYFNRDVECFVTLMLNTRRRVTGHTLISTGLLDSLLVAPREVFRPACIAAAAAIILAHNHPSGDPTPSEADIKVTRDLIRAGQLMKIEVLDHVIMGGATPDRPKDYVSLRELGYFAV